MDDLIFELPVTLFSNFAGLGTVLISLYGMWKLFEKCGVEGWKALIPFYNYYIMFSLFWKKKYFFVQLLIVAILVLFVVGTVIFSEMYYYSYWYYDEAFMALFVIAMVIFIIAAAIFTLVLRIMLAVKIAACFNQKGIFIAGLIFFSMTYTLILALNRDYVYQGNVNDAPAVRF